MKTIVALILCCFAFTGCVAKNLTPEMQSQVDGVKATASMWAADPSVVAAVKAQNTKGPIPGMTNDQWAGLSANDSTVRAIQENAVSQMLASKVKADYKLTGAMVSAAKGEATAFSSKTNKYNHSGTKGFDAAITGQSYVAKPHWSDSADKYVVKVSVPVMDSGKTIGVLTVGVGTEKEGGFVWPWDWTWTSEDWD